MTNLLRLWGLTAASVGFLAACSFSAEPTKDALADVRKSVAEQKAVLVDVREKSEWNAGHVSGAVFLPLSELRNGITAESLAKRIPKQQIVYTHCVAGVRSCTAADILRKYGYDVRPLKPGYKEMIAAGFKKAEK